jgi:hypothetical protein
MRNSAKVTSAVVALDETLPESSTDHLQPSTFSPDDVERLLEDDDNKAFSATGKADLSSALKHQQARIVRDLESIKSFDEHGIERCPCCNYPINAPTFGLCIDTYLLKQLGPGFPLYYRFVMFIWSLLAITFAVAGLAGLVYNLMSDHSSDWDANSDSFTIKCSLGNNGDPDKREEVFPLWQFILHLVSMVVILAAYHLFWTRKQQSLQRDIDYDMLTPSDYTLYAERLGQAFTGEEVKEFFTKFGRPDGQPAEVEKVNVTYDISQFVELSRTLQELKYRHKNLERYKQDHGGADPPPEKCCCCAKSSQSLEDIGARITELQQQLKNHEEGFQPGQGKELLNGQAFVTFKTQEEARMVRYKWEGEWQDLFWNRVFSCFKKAKDYPDFKGHQIKVHRAPEPNDIYWENLGYGFKTRFKNACLTYAVTFTCLCASFGVIFGTSLYQGKINKSYRDDNDPSKIDLLIITSFSILPSLGVVVINVALGQIIRRTSSYEKHHTLTSYHTTVAVKLTIAQCVNTALIALIVNYDPETQWFVPGGLATDMTYILMTNAFVQPFSYLLSPEYMLKLCRQRRFKDNPYLTQAEANLVFEGPPVDMAQRYANVMKTFIVTLAFAALIPLGVLISLFGLVLSYWVDKTLLLKRHSRPNRLSGRLQEVMSKFVPWAVSIYAAMTYVWMNALNPDNSQVALIWLLIVLAFIILPIDTLCKCRKVDFSQFIVAEKSYEEAAVSFVDDYDRENPVTSDEGWTWYFKQLEKAKLIKTEDSSRLQTNLHRRMGNIHDVVSSYATSKASLQIFNRQGANSFCAAFVPSVHQKIKSAIVVNSAQANFINSYQAPPIFTPFNPVYSVPAAKRLLAVVGLRGLAARGIAVEPNLGFRASILPRTESGAVESDGVVIDPTRRMSIRQEVGQVIPWDHHASRFMQRPQRAFYQGREFGQGPAQTYETAHSLSVQFESAEERFTINHKALRPFQNYPKHD